MQIPWGVRNTENRVLFTQHTQVISTFILHTIHEKKQYREKIVHLLINQTSHHVTEENMLSEKSKDLCS